MTFKFEPDDQKNLEQLRISLPSNAAATAVELATQFNEQIEPLQERLVQYFAVPEIDPMTIEFKDAEQTGQDRRFQKFSLVKSYFQLLTARIAINDSIQLELTNAVSEARKRLDAQQAEATERLKSVLSGPDLTTAVNSSDKVKAAAATLELQKQNNTLMNGPSNKPAGVVRTIHAGLMSRYSSWVATIAEIERSPERARLQPEIRKNGVLVSPLSDADDSA